MNVHTTKSSQNERVFSCNVYLVISILILNFNQVKLLDYEEAPVREEIPADLYNIFFPWSGIAAFDTTAPARTFAF